MAITNYQDIIDNKCNLAPSQLMTLSAANKNKSFVRDLLSRKLEFTDNGNEVGSINYISKSTKYFIRAKALQKESFLPSITEKTAISIRPQVFTDFKLKEGDILISKDSNIGEVVILDEDLPNHTISGALYKLPIKENKYYLFAFLKHSYFFNQLDLITPKGSTIRHSKTLFLDCNIPFPNQKNKDDVIIYVELLTQSIINKEKEIGKKHKEILKQIEKELLGNQKDKGFNYELPNFKEIKNSNRVDAGYYCKDYQEKQYLIKNYKNGAKELMSWGYSSKRGQNLQISQIGKSIYSDTPKDNFYTLIRPTNFSEFGTVEKFEYLGNPKELSTLNAGDIIFSAEGTIGKCTLFTNPKSRWITNIHGIVLKKKKQDIVESAFIACFLRFLRDFGTLDYISVGGQGGSLAKKYWKDILIPNFSKQKQKNIASLYHNQVNYPQSLNLQNFLIEDQKWNKKAGIIEIDKSVKMTKKLLNKVLDKIVNNENVEIKFDELKEFL